MSSASKICPRSILRYRPIEIKTVPTVPPWKRTTGRCRPCPTQAVQPSLFSAHASGSLAALVGLGMCLTLLLLLIGQWLVGWAHLALDDWRYGRPRTFQTDLFVGHETTGHPSHFLALNNHGQVEIIEFPGNDPTHARLFLGPHLVSMNADLVPITLRFPDPHHTHHPDMLVHCGSISVLFLNWHGTFQLDAKSS